LTPLTLLHLKASSAEKLFQMQLSKNHLLKTKVNIEKRV
jgi:hypothetical protein